MTNPLTLVMAFGDAVVLSYERSFEDLTISVRLWDESTTQIVAGGVGLLEDTGTWECDGIVRVESLDQGEAFGYAVVDSESKLTLRFVAKTVTRLDDT